MTKELKCKIIKKICLVDESDKSAILFGEISWNGREPKGYDIRHFNKSDNKPYKGISVSKEGFKNIIIAAIKDGCLTEDELDSELINQLNKIFDKDDFEKMFNDVNKEHKKYTRDKYGILRNSDGRAVILSRK